MPILVLCGCGRTNPKGTPCPCQVQAKRERDKRHDASRPNARRRGYTREWEKARRLFLQRNPLCAHPGCGAPATVVDHVTPHRGDPALFWDRSNWQPLCAHHHNAHKQRLERAGMDPRP